MRSQIFLVAALLSTTSIVSASSAVASSSAAPIDQLNDKLSGVLRLLDSCEETLRVVQGAPPGTEHVAVKAKLNEIQTELGDASDKFENVLATVTSTKPASPTKANLTSSSSVTTAPLVVSTTTISKAAAPAPVATMNASSTLGSSPSGSSVSTEYDGDFDEIQIPTNAALSGNKRVRETIVSPPQAVADVAAKKARPDEIQIPTNAALSGNKRVRETIVPQAVVDEVAKKARPEENPAFNATAASASGVVIDMTRSEAETRSPPSKTVSAASLASLLTSDVVKARMQRFMEKNPNFSAYNTSAAPVNSAPVNSAQIQSAQLQSAQNQSAPARSLPVQSAQNQSAPARSLPVQSAQNQSAPFRSLPVQSAPVISKTSAFTLNTSAPNVSTVSLSTTAAAPNTGTSTSSLDDVVPLMFQGEFTPFAQALNPFVKSRACLDPTSNGKTLFEIAVRDGANLAVVKFLLGAKCFVMEFANKENVIEFAITEKNLDLLKALLNNSEFAKEFKDNFPGLLGHSSLHGTEELNEFIILKSLELQK